MKRLVLAMFGTKAQLWELRREQAFTAETPWAQAYLAGSSERMPTDYVSTEEGKLLSVALGFSQGRYDDWYTVGVGQENRFASLPTGLVLDKINRAAEALGILED
jgi:hypothetical protein